MVEELSHTGHTLQPDRMPHRCIGSGRSSRLLLLRESMCSLSNPVHDHLSKLQVWMGQAAIEQHQFGSVAQIAYLVVVHLKGLATTVNRRQRRVVAGDPETYCARES